MYDKQINLMYDFVDDAKASAEESQGQFNKIPWLLKQYWFQRQIRRIIAPDALGPRFNFNRDVLENLVKKLNSISNQRIRYFQYEYIFLLS